MGQGQLAAEVFAGLSHPSFCGPREFAKFSSSLKDTLQHSVFKEKNNE